MTCPDCGPGLLDRFVAAMCLLGLVVVSQTFQSVARADQIFTGGISYVGARIVGLEQGRLRFRGADGTLHTAWIDEVELMIVDRGGVFADFNQAERFRAGGEPERAIVRYRRTMALVDEFWPELIAVRLFLACDAAGRLDHAVLNFIRVIRGRWTGEPAAARLFPRAIPQKRDGKFVRALRRTDTALAEEPEDAERVLLLLLRYEILQRTGDRGSLSAARAVAGFSIPETGQSERAYAILLAAMRESLPYEIGAEALGALDRTIRDCPDVMLPDFLLVKGRMLLQAATTREEIIRASWPLMRVAIHFPDDPPAPEGLYGSALALERIGRRDKAVELLAECLEHTQLTAETRQLAEAAMHRLQSAPGHPG